MSKSNLSPFGVGGGAAGGGGGGGGTTKATLITRTTFTGNFDSSDASDFEDIADMIAAPANWSYVMINFGANTANNGGSATQRDNHESTIRCC